MKTDIKAEWRTKFENYTGDAWQATGDEIDELIDKAISQTRERDIALITTHTEHEGGYCDTGEDMEWACRSECVELAVKRLRKLV